MSNGSPQPSPCAAITRLSDFDGSWLGIVFSDDERFSRLLQLICLLVRSRCCSHRLQCASWEALVGSFEGCLFLHPHLHSVPVQSVKYASRREEPAPAFTGKKWVPLIAASKQRVLAEQCGSSIGSAFLLPFVCFREYGPERWSCNLTLHLVGPSDKEFSTRLRFHS